MSTGTPTPEDDLDFGQTIPGLQRAGGNVNAEPFNDLELGATLRGFAAGQTLFGRFRLVRTLGRGGMGVVWLAQDEQLEREVALKFLPEMLVSDRAALEDLKRETRRSLALTHHHIVRIFDFHQQGAVAGISMEYVDGDTLSNMRAEKESRVFEIAELTPWVRQLCEAMDYAHRTAKIVHRDLKSANLMVNRAGELKVTDFGISASITESASRVSVRPGGGTLAYMSPQQLLGEDTAPSDDIYSLGATLYDLLTGRPPFYQGNIDLQIREKVPPSIAQRRGAQGTGAEPVPEAWERTIAACLEKDPAKRPQSAAEVWERLNEHEAVAPQVEAIETYEVTEAVEEMQTAPVKESSDAGINAGRKLLFIAAVTVIVIALLGSVASWWWSVEKPRRERTTAAAQQARTAKEKADAETANIAEQAYKKQEADDAAEKERQRIAKEKAAAERMRHVKIDEMLKTAQAALTDNRYADARTAYRDLLVFDAGNAVAETGLAEVDKAEHAAMALAEKQRAANEEKQRNEEESKRKAGSLERLIKASKDTPWQNSLGMKFVPVPIVNGPTGGKKVLFSTWDTRVQDYEVFAKDTGREYKKPSFAQGATHPVVNVNWDAAKAFCSWLTEKERKKGWLGENHMYRLPSDHEWSCAVGIGAREDAKIAPVDKDSRIRDEYPWGAWPPKKGAGNYGHQFETLTAASKVTFAKVDNFDYTSPVGSFSENRYGLYDIGGNVWQWCEDWYDNTLTAKVLRGGSWTSNMCGHMESSFRMTAQPGLIGTDELGFRCVLVIGK